MKNETDVVINQADVQKSRENQPTDEILVDIQTEDENIFVVRTKRSGMHAIQQND